jgi:hypothetical protein
MADNARNRNMKQAPESESDSDDDEKEDNNDDSGSESEDDDDIYEDDFKKKYESGEIGPTVDMVDDISDEAVAPKPKSKSDIISKKDVTKKGQMARSVIKEKDDHTKTRPKKDKTPLSDNIEESQQSEKNQASDDEETVIISPDSKHGVIGLFKVEWFEVNNWNWDAYKTPVKKNANRKMCTVLKNYMPHKGDVKPFHVENRLEYLGIKNNKKNYDAVKLQIDEHQKACRRSIKAWLGRFFYENAKYLNIYCPGQYPDQKIECRNSKDLMLAMASCKTKAEVMNCFRLLYMIFDYMPEYTSKLGSMVMEEHSLELDEDEVKEELIKKAEQGKKYRHTKHCFELLVPVMLSDVRKPYKDLLKNTYGLDFSTKGTKLTKNNNTTWYKRERFVEYSWMLKGEYVSIYTT